ncbi:MAG: kelch repeat-containing protein, partial [Acidimicrobiales bacterium]|nr:kelch repeat-containing protein [Acidimicrobiales bacterium]
MAVGLLMMLLACACRGDEGPASPEAERGSTPAAMPVPRTEVSGARWGDEIVVAGGLLPDNTASPRVDRYSPETNAWARLPDLPVALHHAAMATLGDALYVLGGYTTDGSTWVESARVFRLERGANAWSEAAALPVPRGAHAAVAVGGNIVVIAGVSGGQVSASTAVFDPLTGWRPGPPLREAREHLAATTVGSRVYAIAGRVGSANYASVETWDLGSEAWHAAPSLQHSRGGIGAATVRGKACVAGGEETAGTIAPVECLEDDAWRPIGDLRVPRHGLAVV